MFLITELIVLLTSNLVLTQALGTSTLFIAAGSRKNLVGTAFTITLFTTAGSAIAYFISNMLPDSAKDFTLFFYALAIGVLYVLFLTMLYLVSRKHFRNARKYVHLSAFNCAVMGTLLAITQSAEANPQFNNISSFIIAGAEAGLGFILASLILTTAYRRLNSTDVPSAFRGFPAMLIYLGIISMAVYSLT